MKDNDQEHVELDMYLEPMVETAVQAEADASEPVIICVSHCK